MKLMKKMTAEKREGGFTILELSLALVGVAFIILFIITVLIQVLNVYNKGLVMRRIDQTGRQLASDLSNQSRFGARLDTTALGAGRLCVGGVAYLWNLTGSDDEHLFPTTEYRDGAEVTTNSYSGSDNAVAMAATDNNLFGLVRVENPSGSYCQMQNNDEYLMPPRGGDGVTELIARNAAVLDVRAITAATGGLMTVEFVLSTPDDNTAVFVPAEPDSGDEDTWQCTIDGRPNQFCAVADFNMTVYQRKAD